MMIGQTFGPYYILDSIRLGGLLADLYLATDHSGQRYALRLLRVQFREDRAVVRQFMATTEVIHEFDHPNVIRLLAYGKIERVPYAVLEYVESANLKELMLRKDQLITNAPLFILQQVASGLKHIHDRGYLHLDMKPENVLVTAEAGVKVIDFDLSIPKPDQPKRLRRVSGTLAYLAPELIADQIVDERTDIFAFGVLAYKLFTGREPMVGQSRKELLAKYADYRHHFTPPRQHNTSMSANMEKIILRCLEKDAARRYPSMSLVVRDLQFVSGVRAFQPQTGLAPDAG